MLHVHLCICIPNTWKTPVTVLWSLWMQMNVFKSLWVTLVSVICPESQCCWGFWVQTSHLSSFWARWSVCRGDAEGSQQRDRSDLDEWLNRYCTDTRAVSQSRFRWVMAPARLHHTTSIFPPHLSESTLSASSLVRTTTSFTSILGKISFHHLGSALSCSGSDVTGPCDCSGKKGSIVSGELLFCCKHWRIREDGCGGGFGSRRMRWIYCV